MHSINHRLPSMRSALNWIKHTVKTSQWVRVLCSIAVVVVVVEWQMCCERNTQFDGGNERKETTDENSLNRFCSLNSLRHIIYFTAHAFIFVLVLHTAPYVCAPRLCVLMLMLRYTSYTHFPFVASHSHKRAHSCIARTRALCVPTDDRHFYGVCVYTRGPRVVIGEWPSCAMSENHNLFCRWDWTWTDRSVAACAFVNNNKIYFTAFSVQCRARRTRPISSFFFLPFFWYTESNDGRRPLQRLFIL